MRDIINEVEQLKRKVCSLEKSIQDGGGGTGSTPVYVDSETIAGNGTSTSPFTVIDDEEIHYRGLWQEGIIYEKYDQVIQDGYTGIANKQTTDSLAPVLIGNPEYYYTNNNITATGVFSSQITRGVIFKSRDYGISITGYSIQVYENQRYEILLVKNPNGSRQIQNIGSFDSFVAEEKIFNIDQKLIDKNTEYAILVVITTLAPTLRAGYNYLWSIGTENPPVNGVIRVSSGILEVSKIDSAGIDHSPELDSLVSGDVVSNGLQQYTIQNVINVNPQYISFEIIPSQISYASTIYSTTFTPRNVSPIVFPQDTNYFASTADIRGLISDSTPWDSVIEDLNYYGINVLYQKASVSPDWDIVSYPSILGSQPETSFAKLNVVGTKKTTIDIFSSGGIYSILLPEGEHYIRDCDVVVYLQNRRTDGTITPSSSSPKYNLSGGQVRPVSLRIVNARTGVAKEAIRSYLYEAIDAEAATLSGTTSVRDIFDLPTYGDNLLNRVNVGRHGNFFWANFKGTCSKPNSFTNINSIRIDANYHFDLTGDLVDDRYKLEFTFYPGDTLADNTTEAFDLVDGHIIYLNNDVVEMTASEIKFSESTDNTVADLLNWQKIEINSLPLSSTPTAIPLVDNNGPFINVIGNVLKTKKEGASYEWKYRMNMTATSNNSEFKYGFRLNGTNLQGEKQAIDANSGVYEKTITTLDTSLSDTREVTLTDTGAGDITLDGGYILVREINILN